MTTPTEADRTPSSEQAGVIAEIAAERLRQIEVEGWTAEHDDEHSAFEMARAAACYCMTCAGLQCLRIWPRSWSFNWFKPTEARRNLVKAAALIVAEIERLDRATPQPDHPEGSATSEGGGK